MGSPNADGNTMSMAMPATEFVPASVMKDVKKALIYSQIPGKRTFAEIFERTFREHFRTADATQIQRMVAISLKRQEEGYLPTCVMSQYREASAFHARHACK